MYYIDKTSTSSMNNAYFVAFHQSVASVIDKYGASSLGVNTEDYSEYRQVLSKLDDAVLKTQGSDKTANIAQLDEKRDRLFRYVRNVFDNLKYSDDSEIVKIAELADAKILNLYTSKIASESYQEETTHINGFVIDVRKYFAANLGKLGIADALTALETANNNFKEAYLDRSDELSAIVSGATKKYRKQCEELYQKIEIAINYHASQTRAKDEDTVMRRDACESFIALLNQYIGETWQSIKLGKALTKPTENGGVSTGGTSTGTNTKPTGGTSSPTGGGQEGASGGLADLG